MNLFSSYVVLPVSLRRRVDAYERQLVSRNKGALRRTLRDKRSDRRILRLWRAGEDLPEKDIRRLLDFYARSLAGYTADLESELVKRQRKMQALISDWRGALGQYPAEVRRRAVKRWETKEDDVVRHDHEKMSGVTVPFEGMFATYDTGYIVAPPVAYGCRCWISVFVLDEDLNFDKDGNVILPEGLR